MLTLISDRKCVEQIVINFSSYLMKVIRGLTSACAHLLISSLRKNKVIKHVHY